MWIILTLISAFTFSVRQIMEKHILKSTDPIDFMTAYSVIVTIMLLPMIFFVEFTIPFFIFLLMLAFKVFEIFSVVLLFKAMKNSEVSSLAPFLNLTPVFVLFLGFIFLDELPNNMQILGIVIVMLGVYVLLMKKSLFKIFHIAKPRFMWYATITAFIWGVNAVIIRYILKFLDIYTFFFFSNALFFVMVIILAFYRKRLAAIPKAIKQAPGVYVLVSFLAIISNFTVQFALAIPAALTALVLPIRRTSTLFTIILGGKFFKEKNLVRKMIACFIMLIGIVLISI